jgi:hypothetical protein
MQPLSRAPFVRVLAEKMRSLQLATFLKKTQTLQPDCNLSSPLISSTASTAAKGDGSDIISC